MCGFLCLPAGIQWAVDRVGWIERRRNPKLRLPYDNTYTTGLTQDARTMPVEPVETVHLGHQNVHFDKLNQRFA